MHNKTIFVLPITILIEYHDKVLFTIHEDHVHLNVWCVLIRNHHLMIAPGLKYAGLLCTHSTFVYYT